MSEERNVYFDEHQWSLIVATASDVDESPEEFVRRITWDALNDHDMDMP